MLSWHRNWLRMLPLAGALCAGASPATDLVSVYRDAKTQDSAYAAAEAGWRATREKLPQGLAQMLPSATLSANTSINDREILFRNGTNAIGRFNSNSVGVSVVQPILRLQNNAQYEQARAQVEQADAQLAAAAQDLALRVAQLYFDVLLAQDNLQLAGAQKEAFARQLEQARRFFKVGIGAITDAQEAQTRFDHAASQEIAAKNDLEIRKHALQLIVTAAPPPLAGLGPGFVPERPSPDNMAAWVEQALARNRLLSAQRSALEIATHGVAKSRYEHFPTLDAIASYTRSGTGSGFEGGVGNDTTNKVLGLQFSLPLFQGGGTVSRVRESLATEDKARHDLETTSRQVVLATRQAFLEVDSGVAQVRAREQGVASARKQLDSTKLGREVGVRTGIDVLNSQQLLTQAERDLAQARYAYILAWLRLKSSVGELGEDDLARVNKWLSDK